jgi:hypothetical protein
VTCGSLDTLGYNMIALSLSQVAQG